MVGKMESANSSENLRTALQTIKSCVAELSTVVDASDYSQVKNQTVSRLVLNARDSLESALQCARREKNNSPNSGDETAVYDDVDAESHSSDITIDLEEDLANITTQVLIDEPDWDEDVDQDTSDASVDILDASVSHKNDNKSNSTSRAVDDDLPKNGTDSDTGTNTAAGSAAVTDAPSNQIEEFADINFDDDFSNDGHLEGTEMGDPEELLQSETSQYAELIVIVFPFYNPYVLIMRHIDVSCSYYGCTTNVFFFSCYQHTPHHPLLPA